MVTNYHQIKTSIKEKKFSPVYLLHGSEPYFIDDIAQELESSILAEEEKVFNQVILYGKDVNAQIVQDHAQRYPMMAPYQVIILREAQEMKDIKDLEGYIKNPVPTTVLALCYKHKSIDSNTSFGKTLEKNAVVFKSDKIKDYQLEEWITQYCKTEKLRIASSSVSLLAEYLGADLSVVVHELQKVALHLKPGEEITPQHIENFIGISREYNLFELHKALANKDERKTIRILKYLVNSPDSGIIPVVSSLVNFFMKVYSMHFIKSSSDSEIMTALGFRNTYSVKEYRQAVKNFPLQKIESIISTLRDYDLKSKGVRYNTTGKEDSELLTEMMWQILN
jgi:DNA polymerase-3 subunit delta